MKRSDTLVEPAHLWVPEHDVSFGAEAADLADLAGMTLDGEQRLVLDAFYASRGDRWAAFEAAVICSRQNLKTHILVASALADLFLFDAELVIWTAHLYDTAQEAFRSITQIIEGTPELSRRVKRVSNSHGDEGVELTSGARINFLARSKTGGRGLTGDVVILDEGFALDAAVMGSLMPTLSARPNPQVRYGSSAGMLRSDVLRGIRRRGREGQDPSLAYVEWCAPEGGCGDDDCDHMTGRSGCALDDRENWRKSNPAMGRRISEDFIAAERRTLPPVEFARERLGWWEDPVGGDSGIDPGAWSAAADPAGQIVGTPHLAVDVSPSRWTAVAISGMSAEGYRQVEVPWFRRGTAGVAGDIKGICDRNNIPEVLLDPSGPAGSLIPALEAAGLTVRQVSIREYAQACGGFVDAVTQGQIRHLDDQYLNLSVQGAARKPSGDAWVWHRRDSAMGGAPLVAATLADWATASQETESFAW